MPGRPTFLLPSSLGFRLPGGPLLRLRRIGHRGFLSWTIETTLPRCWPRGDARGSGRSAPASHDRFSSGSRSGAPGCRPPARTRAPARRTTARPRRLARSSRPCGTRAARPRTAGTRKAAPSPRSASTMISACAGGTTSSSAPCSSSIGRREQVDRVDRDSAPGRDRSASGHGPTSVCSYRDSNLCVSPVANGSRSLMP